MQIAVFGKKRTTKEGKSFNSYFSTLTKKSGEEVKCTVKFREDCGAPELKDLPMNIVFEQKDGNLSSKKYTVLDENTGEMIEKTGFTLWLNGWREGDPYVDHSLDEFF